MSKQPDIQELNAFVDGELDLTRQIEIEALLRQDTTLRTEVEKLRGLQEAVRSRADYHVATTVLRGQILSLAATQSPANKQGAPADAHLESVWQRWFAWRPWVPATAMVAALAVGINVLLMHGHQDERLEQEVIASHARATLAQHLVDVESSNHHTVKPWLSARLDFSPPVQELSLPGSSLVGGRVDYLDGRPVAALVYRHAGHVVEQFVWPAQGDQRVAISSQRGFNVGHWSRAGMAHWVVSDLNPTEFADLVHDLGRSD